MAQFDPNVFLEGSRQRAQSGQNLANTLMQIANNYQKNQQFQQEMQAQKAKQAYEQASDPQNILAKAYMGQPLTPQEEAIFQASQTMAGAKRALDPLGRAYAPYQPIDLASVRGQQAEQTPITQTLAETAGILPAPQVEQPKDIGVSESVMQSPEIQKERAKAKVQEDFEIRKEQRAKEEKNKESVRNSKELVRLAKKLKEHKGLNKAVGALQGQYSKSIPLGSGVGSFNALEKQILGKTFLESREALKGAGAVTDFEGMKAEEAMSRINRVQDEDSYREAVDDLIKVTENSIARAQGQKPPHDFSDEEKQWELSGGDIDNRIKKPSEMTDDEIKMELGL